MDTTLSCHRMDFLLRITGMKTSTMRSKQGMSCFLFQKSSGTRSVREKYNFRNPKIENPLMTQMDADILG